MPSSAASKYTSDALKTSVRAEAKRLTALVATSRYEEGKTLVGMRREGVCYWPVWAKRRVRR